MKRSVALILAGLGSLLMATAQQAVPVDENSTRAGAPVEGAVEGAEQAEAQPEALPLPEWKAEDRKALIRGVLIPGKALLGMEDLPENLEEVPSIKDYEMADAEDSYDPRSLPQEVLPRYEVRQPGSYLLDPQFLLTMQERRDVEYFLKLQGKGSPINISLILFDREQVVPTDLNLRSMMQGLYRPDEWTVVVQYHMGNPKRTQLALSRDLWPVIEEGKRLEILRKSISGSLRQSDPESQLQSFLIALSNELYWLEKEVVGLQAASEEAYGSVEPSTREQGTPVAAGGPAGGDDERMTLSKALAQALHVAGMTGVSLLGAALLAGLYVLYLKLRPYRFPDVPFDVRLGAEHGAGVGPVLNFKNPNLSPSRQRSEAMPDYLTKI